MGPADRRDPFRSCSGWRSYDIRLKLQEEWPRIGPLLAGKLHIITGSLDTFFLEGAVEKLAQTLHDLGSDAVVEIVPGKNHGDLLTPELSARFRREMTARFRHLEIAQKGQKTADAEDSLTAPDP